jgi:hypothetical protein
MNQWSITMIPQQQQSEEVVEANELEGAAESCVETTKLSYEQICEALSDGVIRAEIHAVLERGRHRNHRGLEDALQRAIKMALGHPEQFSTTTHLKYWIHASATGNLKRQHQYDKGFDTPGADTTEGDFLNKAFTEASGQRWNGSPYVAHRPNDFTSKRDYALDLKTCIARATSNRALQHALWGHVFLKYRQNDDELYEKCGKGRQFGKTGASSQRSFTNALSDAKKELSRHLILAGYFDEADALMAAKVYPWLARQPRAQKPLKHGGWRHASDQSGLPASKPTGTSDWTNFPYGYANFLQRQIEGTFMTATITERREEPEVVRSPVDSEYSRAWDQAKEDLLKNGPPPSTFVREKGLWARAKKAA